MRGFVVLSAGWSGDRVLVRLLSAAGAVRVIGQPLDRPVRDPAGRLRRLLATPVRGPMRAAVVLPHHLWLRNDLDATAFVADLHTDGFVVMTLARRTGEDRGLSLALCGPRSEVLPTAPRHLDAGEVALYAHESDLAVEWFEQVVPDAARRVIFEDDLATPAARATTATRLASILALQPWEAPVDREVPDHVALWGAVANPAALRADLELLQRGARA